MIREKWNDSWFVTKSPVIPSVLPGVDRPENGKAVRLPYDAMIHEKKDRNTKNAHQTGFYPGFQYTYSKRFFAPEQWKDKMVLLEFEGVYPGARVYLNGDFAGGYPNGYSGFYVCADDFLEYESENVIQVVANNSAELNSRWYSGSGIYRDVSIMVCDHLHVAADGVRITVPDADAAAAVAVVDTAVENNACQKRRAVLCTEILDGDGNTVAEDRIPFTAFGRRTDTFHQRLFLKKPRLWSCDSPNLYTSRVRILEGDATIDETVCSFGVRRFSLDPQNGLRINGERVKLRGACIHHDNGVIGAATLRRAEERRCRKLKEAGFNCIRSAHHPMSKAMLDACDREGMLVIDELSDMWMRPKNTNDYSQFFPDYWERDVEKLVAKDFNHPCVVLYTTGNEIPESATEKGAEMNRRIADKIRSLDGTRYITTAISGILASKEHLTEYFDGEAETERREQSEAGSDAENDLLAMMTGPAADAMAASPHVSEVIDEFAAPLDVAGYNYLTGRHAMDHAIRPNRLVLGIETFPSDIVRLWGIVKENPHVLGDVTWAGYDYLGEAGMGVFYYDGRRGFYPNWPCTTAYAGDIDITGFRRTISYLREIVYGLRESPYIAVERVNHYGEKPNKTPWMWKDEIASWTWRGYEGKSAVINVYAAADEVELYLNGRLLGRKPAGEKNGYQAVFKTVYEPGELTAFGYCNGEQTGVCRLQSASGRTKLQLSADRTELAADGDDLAFIDVFLADENGNTDMQAKRTVSVRVEGAGTLQGFGSANPETEAGYDDTAWETYDGHLLAAVRAGTCPGTLAVTFSADGCEDVTIEIKTVKPNKA